VRERCLSSELLSRCPREGLKRAIQYLGSASAVDSTYSGARAGIRTLNLGIKSPLLCQVELRGQLVKVRLYLVTSSFPGARMGRRLLAAQRPGSDTC
jgi:hypothetical protein